MLEVPVDDEEVGRWEADAICASVRAVSVRPEQTRIQYLCVWSCHRERTFLLRRVLVRLPRQLWHFCPTPIAECLVQLRQISLALLSIRRFRRETHRAGALLWLATRLLATTVAASFL